MATLTTIQVPQEYGYVLLTTAASYVLSMWLGFRIGPFRRAAKVAHPTTYVSAETIAAASSAQEKHALYLFNCAQRAHHNVLENQPTVLSGMLLSGLTYPKLAAAMGAVWIFGRVLYATNYTSASEKNVNGRSRFGGGGFHLAALSQVVLVGLVGKMGVDVLRF